MSAELCCDEATLAEAARLLPLRAEIVSLQVRLGRTLEKCAEQLLHPPTPDTDQHVLTIHQRLLTSYVRRLRIQREQAVELLSRVDAQPSSGSLALRPAVEPPFLSSDEAEEEEEELAQFAADLCRREGILRRCVVDADELLKSPTLPIAERAFELDDVGPSPAATAATFTTPPRAGSTLADVRRSSTTSLQDDGCRPVVGQADASRSGLHKDKPAHVEETSVVALATPYQQHLFVLVVVFAVLGWGLLLLL